MQKELDILATVNQVLCETGLPALSYKASTHHGEWYSMCPRCCRLQTGGNNEDRLLVWPFRPENEDGTRPIAFMCRQCRSERNSSKPWAGSMVTFVMGALNVSYKEACVYLGLPVSGSIVRAEPEPPVPSSSPTGAPNALWQTQGLALVQEAQEALWSDRGKGARNYLMQMRLLQESILREYEIGFLAQERYVDGVLWGLDGKIRIPRGILFAEYHRVKGTQGYYRELWSLSVRLSNSDIEVEAILTGKRAAKYWYVRGSEKGLYGADTIKTGKSALLVEGPVCHLTIQQEMQHEMGSAATQGNNGAHALLWAMRLNFADPVLLGFDPDSAGLAGYTYWHDLLPAEKRLLASPSGGDFNAMLMRGDSIRNFVEVRMNMWECHVVMPREARGVTHVVELNDVPLIPSDALTVISTPQESIERDVQKCVSEHVRQGAVCLVCGSSSVYSYFDEYSFCEQHFAGQLFLERGKNIQWDAFYYEAGYAYSSTQQHRHEWVAAGYVSAGKQHYVDFVVHSFSSTVWRVADALYERLNYHETVRSLSRKPLRHIRTVDVPCARIGCVHNARTSVRLFSEQAYDEKKKKWLYVYPEEMGRSNFLNGTWYRWCPRCRDASLVLEFGDALNFPAYNGGGAEVRIAQGMDAWIDFATHASIFHATWVFDDLRRQYPEKWKLVAMVLFGADHE